MRRLFFVGRRRALRVALADFSATPWRGLEKSERCPASPPCFRRRRTGCGTQHPLRLACVSLAAAPTTPRCFRRWRRSSSLQSAPLLFESTLAALYKLPDKTETPVSLQHWSSWWARVDYASRASKKAPQGPFCRRDVWRRPLLFESTRLCESDICAKENRQCISTPAVFSWARVDSNHRS